MNCQGPVAELPAARTRIIEDYFTRLKGYEKCFLQFPRKFNSCRGFSSSDL